MLKVCTWNVNGIRAREAEVLEWMSASSPTCSACRRSRRRPSRCPSRCCALAGYTAYWHGTRATRASRLLARARPFRERPAFRPSRVRPRDAHRDGRRWRSSRSPRSTSPTAARTSRPRCASSTRSTRYAARAQASGRTLMLCGDLNVARERARRAPALQKPEQIGQTPDERAQFERICSPRAWSTCRASSTPTTIGCSPGGRRGATCASATSAGASTTCSRARRSRSARCRCDAQREFGTSDHGPLTATFAIDPADSLEADPEPEPEPEPQPPPARANCRSSDGLRPAGRGFVLQAGAAFRARHPHDFALDPVPLADRARVFDPTVRGTRAAAVCRAGADLGYPIFGEHHWRQSDVYSVAYNFRHESADFFHPRIDWNNGLSGVMGMEPPILAYAIQIAMRLFGDDPSVARVTSWGLCMLALAGFLAGLWRAQAEASRCSRSARWRSRRWRCSSCARSSPTQ